MGILAPINVTTQRPEGAGADPADVSVIPFAPVLDNLRVFTFSRKRRSVCLCDALKVRFKYSSKQKRRTQ
jgi:hypothetical protein